MDSPTDVLSFPMFELKPGEKPRANWADPDTEKVFLGDMMLSLERANAQAAEFGHSPEREVCYLAVHSQGTSTPSPSSAAKTARRSCSTTA